MHTDRSCDYYPSKYIPTIDKYNELVTSRLSADDRYRAGKARSRDTYQTMVQACHVTYTYNYTEPSWLAVYCLNRLKLCFCSLLSTLFGCLIPVSIHIRPSSWRNMKISAVDALSFFSSTFFGMTTTWQWISWSLYQQFFAQSVCLRTLFYYSYSQTHHSNKLALNYLIRQQRVTRAIQSKS